LGLGGVTHYGIYDGSDFWIDDGSDFWIDDDRDFWIAWAPLPKRRPE
jgi:hypothetical protein